jgi:hypothetical protein
VCGTVASALAFGGWVLSTDDRTERLERLIRAFRGRSGRHVKTQEKK